MAFITDNASSVLHKFQVRRTVTMDTETSHVSYTSSKGSSNRSSRRAGNLMKLIQANQEDRATKLLQRVRLSNSFAKEHHRFQQQTDQPEKPSYRDKQANDIGIPSTMRRYGSMQSLHRSTVERRLLHRYSSLTFGRSAALSWRRASDHLTHLGHLSQQTGFSPKNSSQVLSVIPAKSELLDKFRHAVRILQILIRAVTRAKDCAQKKFSSIDSVSDIPDTAVLAQSESRHESRLIFDLKAFKVTKDQQISHEVKRILRLPSEERDDSCLHKALLNLRNAVDAFSEFPLTMQQSLVKVGWYECFEAKRVIIRQGYRAERYYLILNGSAMVSKMKENQSTKKIDVIPTALLTKGNSFGEDALMRNGCRDSNVIVEQQVEALMIEKDDFMKIFLQKDEGNEPELLQFLRTVDCFSRWPVHRLRYEDPKQCLQVYFRRGSIIAKDVTSSEWIYVIKSGSCRVVRRIAVPADVSKGLNEVCHYGSFNDSKKRLSGSTKNMTSSTSRFRSIRRVDWWNDPSMLAMKPKLIHRHSTVHDELRCTDHVFVNIQQLNARDTFGLLPIAFPHSNDDMTDVTLISDGVECVMISTSEFLHHMSEDHLEYLKENLKPWPSEDNLKRALKEKTQWQEYKRDAIFDAIGKCSKLRDTFQSSHNQ